MQIDKFCELIHTANIDLNVNDCFIFKNEWELKNNVFKSLIYSFIEKKETWISIFSIYSSEIGIFVFPLGISNDTYHTMFYKTFSKLIDIPIGLWHLIIDSEYEIKEKFFEITPNIEYHCLPFKVIHVESESDFLIPCADSLMHFILERDHKSISCSTRIFRKNRAFRNSDWIYYNYDHEISQAEIPMVFCFPEQKDFDSCSQEYTNKLIDRFLSEED